MPAMMMLAGDVDGDDMIKGADQAECSQLLLEDFFPFFFFFFIFRISPFVQVNIVHARPKTI